MTDLMLREKSWPPSFELSKERLFFNHLMPPVSKCLFHFLLNHLMVVALSHFRQTCQPLFLKALLGLPCWIIWTIVHLCSSSFLHLIWRCACCLRLIHIQLGASDIAQLCAVVCHFIFQAYFPPIKARNRTLLLYTWVFLQKCFSYCIKFSTGRISFIFDILGYQTFKNV